MVLSPADWNRCYSCANNAFEFNVCLNPALSFLAESIDERTRPSCFEPQVRLRLILGNAEGVLWLPTWSNLRFID